MTYTEQYLPGFEFLEFPPEFEFEASLSGFFDHTPPAIQR